MMSNPMDLPFDDPPGGKISPDQGLCLASQPEQHTECHHAHRVQVYLEAREDEQMKLFVTSVERNEK